MTKIPALTCIMTVTVPTLPMTLDNVMRYIMYITQNYIQQMSVAVISVRVFSHLQYRCFLSGTPFLISTPGLTHTSYTKNIAEWTVALMSSLLLYLYNWGAFFFIENISTSVLKS